MKALKKVSSKRTRAVHQADDPLSGDLSELMMSADWQVAKFELTKPKNKTITLRISEELLDELKKRAKKLGLDYQRLIRITLENSLRKKAS